MKLEIIIFSCYIFLTTQQNIQKGIYNILYNDLYLSYYNQIISLSATFNENTYFRIRKISKVLNDTFYDIEEIQNNSKLIVSEDNQLDFNIKNNSFLLWNLFKINNNSYAIKSTNNCYIQINNNKNIFCDNTTIDKATQFKLIRIYNEVDEKKNKNNDLLKREPIDILIKYIDLRDPSLNREGIPQIEKDYDNEELRYSIRSILNNIPWIRKIFILMPNEKVKYFKNYNLIQNKIVYIKDKDFLGYDSSNCNAFLFRYWNMKKFGISDNIIIMDDDCFIGNKLEKSDFFYVEKGKVVPAIITNNFVKIEKESVLKNRDDLEIKAKMSLNEQNDDVFNYSKYLTFAFILNLFNISSNESIFIPKFTHNAIPVNLRDIKEIYDLTYKSEYKFATLDCLYRIYGYLQFQIFVLSYTFLKYKRKVKHISYKFIRLNNLIYDNYNFSLFCINKGPGEYSYLEYYKAKIIMEYLFPIPSPYEKVDNSLINIIFNLTSTLDKHIKLYENTIIPKIAKRNSLFLEHIFLFVFFLILIKVNIRYINYD